MLVAIPYVVFPLVLRWKGRGKTLPEVKQKYEGHLVSIVMAVHNEEEVLEEKLSSIFASIYKPFEVLIGSDCSTDKTNEILKKWSKEHPNLHVFYYQERQGKISIINDLVRHAKGNIIVTTDAKAIFYPDTLSHLVSRFNDEKIGIVGAVFVNPRRENVGIVRQEDYYMHGEMMLKYLEGLLYGKVMGVYGALFAIRKKLFPFVPPHLMVDDLYITLKVIEQGYVVVIDTKAKALLRLPVALKEEFRRKVRIAIGDFQILKIFSHWLLRPMRVETWLFVAHKMLRWLTPFFLLSIFLIPFFLLNYFWYRLVLILALLVLSIPFFDMILSKLGFYFYMFRLITHFLAMNLALLVGCFKSFQKRTRAIWVPSKR